MASPETIAIATGMAKALRGLPEAKKRELGNEIAQVAHAAPPGVDRLQFLRGLLNRLDAGTASYEDRIILDVCTRLDLLRLVCQLLEARRQ